MEELYENMGFTSNPFSRFSAEEEKEYLEEIYIKPRYYRTVYNDIKDYYLSVIEESRYQETIKELLEDD